MRLVFDIETTKITQDWPTDLWLIVTKDFDSGKILSFSDSAKLDGSLRDGIDHLKAAKMLIGHNITGFDGPVLSHFFPDFYLLDAEVRDTSILSQLLCPDIDPVGGSKHSLGAWGQRMRYGKSKFSDFDKYSDEMLEYCKRDVLVCEKLMRKFVPELLSHDWSAALQLENEFSYFTSLHPQAWPIDIDLLRDHVHKLETLRDTISSQLVEMAPPVIIKDEVPKKVFTKAGLPTAISIKDSEAGRFKLEDIRGEYCRVDFVPINLASPDQVKTWLLSLGWKPDTWTYETDDYNKPLRDENGERIKKSPSLKDSEFIGIPQVIGEKLTESRVVAHRLNTMRGWLSRQEDGYLQYGMLTCACNTGRVQHHTIVNVPKADDDVFFGSEMREIFRAPEGYVMLGLDLSQIEAKLQGHYTSKYDGGKWAEFLLNNDIHEFNAAEWGLTRSKAKGPEYGMCVPVDTLCLTRRGWKTYDELIIGEEVLGYNQETGLKEWTTLTGINVMEDEVIDFGHTYKRFRATKNHRWFVKQRKRTYNGKGWVTTGGDYMVDKVLTTEELTTGSNIILNAPFNIEQDTKDLGAEFSRKYESDWVTRVLHMPHNERVQFLQGFMLADGWNTRKGKEYTWHWSQVDGEIYEALLLASYLAHHGQIHSTKQVNTHSGVKNVNKVTLSKKGHICCQTLTKKVLPRQTVWCPTTKLGSWVMRQGDVISITGNSYGCQIPGLQEKFGFSEDEARNIFNNYWKVRWALKQLKEELVLSLEKRDQIFRGKVKENAWIKSLDGRKVKVRSAHALINTLIQSAATVIAKAWTIKCVKYIVDNNIDARLAIMYHDENQFFVKEEDAEHLLNKFKQFSLDVGKEYKIRVPITSSGSIGNNWAETH